MRGGVGVFTRLKFFFEETRVSLAEQLARWTGSSEAAREFKSRCER